MVADGRMQFWPGEKAVKFRNTIRLMVAAAATGALTIGVSMFHTGGDLQTAGNLVRASLVSLAPVIASLVLEIGRGMETLADLAVGQKIRFKTYEDQIERDVERAQKLWIAAQIIACLLILPTAAGVWYLQDSITTFLFGTPGTRFIVSMGRQSCGVITYSWMLLVAIQPVRFGLLLLVAKTYPFGAAQVASYQDTNTIFLDEDRRYYISVSRIVYFRVFFVLLTVILLVNVVLSVSYVRIADQGIGFVEVLGTTEVFHPWTDVCSITERYFVDGEHPVRDYTIQFIDGSKWKSTSISHDSSWIWGWDPKAAIEFAADRAHLPVKLVIED